MRKAINLSIVLIILLCPIFASTGESSPDLVLYAPVVINCGLFLIFFYSLIRTPSVAEKMARRWRLDLPGEVVAYCWWVTLVWVLFFVCNGLISLFTALSGDLWLWSFYNGVVAYLLIAMLFAGELTYRYWRFRPYVGAPTDVIFKKIFPPDKSV